MTSSIEVAWKPSRAKHRHALVRMCWRLCSRVLSLSRGMTPRLNEKFSLRYGRGWGSLLPKSKDFFPFRGEDMARNIPTQTDVLIVGAGPTGVALAPSLGALGVGL